MADVLALREALHDALCDFGKPHGCHAYDALDRYAAAVRAEAQAIAWAEHSLERNEAVAALFRLLPDSMFPESFDALMERVVAIEALAAVRAGAAAGSGLCGYFSRGGYVHFCDLPADHPWHVGPHRHHDFRPRPATPPTPACCLNCGEPVGSSAHLIACHTPETVR